MRATKFSEPLTGRSLTLDAFIALVSALGLLVVVHSVYTLPATPRPLGWLAVGALAVIAGSFPLKVPGMPVYLSISDTFLITSAVWFGPAPAIATIAVDSLNISCRRSKTGDQLLFNTTSSALSLWAGAKVFFWVQGAGPLADSVKPPDVTTVVALAALATVYFALNSGLVATAVALQKRIQVFALWQQHFAVVAVTYFAAASASLLLIVLMRFVSPLALAAVVPLLVIFYMAMRSWMGRVSDGLQHVENVNRLYLSTVSALATVIEAKDGATSDHLHRVQAYAMGLAHALNVTDRSTLQAIEAAALLHDTGKLAIPEYILNKPGRLTPSEFDTMKTHVDVGAEVLSSIDFPYPVVPTVRAHHEKWDGTGYPAGLRGTAIPIGARILAVVDCFDALTSDRPYRPAMSVHEALDIIVAARGTAYDPEVVDAFVRVYREIAVPAPRPQLDEALGRIRGSVAQNRQQPPQWRHIEVPPQAPEALLALVSLARVASGRSTIADIGALAWAQLRNIASGASLVLFTVEAERHALVAQYAAGVGAEGLHGIVIEVGQRVTGWVAANARTAVNSDARLDLSSGATGSLRFALAVPLVADSVVVGVMTLYAPEPFAADQNRMFEMIAPHLALAVASTLTDRFPGTPLTYMGPIVRAQDGFEERGATVMSRHSAGKRDVDM